MPIEVSQRGDGLLEKGRTEVHTLLSRFVNERLVGTYSNEQELTDSLKEWKTFLQENAPKFLDDKDWNELNFLRYGMQFTDGYESVDWRDVQNQEILQIYAAWGMGGPFTVALVEYISEETE